MKQYKSPNDLLEYMISKGVNVINKDKALDKIKKYSYYSIINSYKDIFKTSKNTYKKGVSFDEIYALYKFDKNIRLIFLKYILEIETVIKSLLAETISSKYGVENYLVLKNFDNRVNSLKIQESIDKIKEEINKQNGKHEAVSHYISKYGFVPPFVLVKILTLGELSRLYSILKQEDRQSISKEFKISDKLLKQILKNMTMVRNICAHNDRLFCYRDKYTLKFKEIDSNYTPKDNLTNLYMMIRAMQILLEKRQYNSLVKAVEKEINKLNNKLNSININNILRIMGYPNV